MLHKTRGIVINYIKYRETSVIVKIYTEEFGLQSYVINSIRSKASKKSLALLQPLSLLELVVYKKKNHNGGISRLSEFRPAFTYKTIPFDIKKSTIVIFVTEWLSKILAEDELDHSGQFEFFFRSFETFDSLVSGYENFHLQLMVKATSFLGFGVIRARNLITTDKAVNEGMMSVAERTVTLGKMDYDQPYPMSNMDRKEVIDLLMNYYKSHIESFGEIKSANILKNVFHG
ncbi:MAG: DNA repair protein RecO [Cyclobacteriaceae bacterium]